MSELQRAAVKEFALGLCAKGCKYCANGSPVWRNSSGKWSHNDHGNCCNSQFIHQALNNWLDTHVGPIVPLPTAPALTPKQEAAEEMFEALHFYVAICGNTAARIGRESAQQAYELAAKALAKAGRA